MVYKKTLLYTIALIVILASCKFGIDGKIEKRQSKCGGIEKSHSMYLVNTSKTKRIRFTIKEKEVINDTATTYITYQESLEPGDETELGCNLKLGKTEFKKLIIPFRVDTIIYYNQKILNSVSQIKYYCTKDTSLLRYSFNYEIIGDAESRWSESYAKKVLLEKQYTDIKNWLPKHNLFIGVRDKELSINEEQTKLRKQLIMDLICIDPDEDLKTNVYKYTYKVTGQTELDN